AGTRTVAFTARVERGAEERLAALGTIVVPIADRPQDTLASKRRAAELLERAAARFARIVHAGDG
ncbi:MAG: hypothetical protein IAI48_06975, partial [Candidatus Eremiobacteraeota bacterium]|nr:hypothetical protein [Candidatus Eremiobacteraeota bacterium]